MNCVATQSLALWRVFYLRLWKEYLHPLMVFQKIRNIGDKESEHGA